MAEQIPYGVASSLITRLASAAFREFGRIYGVMDGLDRIKNTIESIRVVLVDAEEKQEQNHVVQHWIRRLKDDVLHPADDMLDEFFLEDMRHKGNEAQQNKVKEVLHSFSPHRIAFRIKMAHKIEKLQKEINDVVKDMAGLNLTPHVVVINQNDSVKRETGSFVLELDIIGREDNKNEIISLLRQPHTNHNVSFIAIVGIGGLGKTALAQLVYNDVEVQNLFEAQMWVCVSDNFDVKTIVKKILESLINSKIDDKLSLDNLQNTLRENLTGKRYLLVLDDMWNEIHHKWNELRTYLMCGAQDSKILVTTRSKIVAQTMGISTPYVLNGLNTEESWSLLKNIAFGNDTEDMIIKTLEPIGKKIAEKCKGVPLAIRTLGGLLQNTSEKSEWTDVLLGEFWQLCEDEGSIMPVLKLSYKNLSPQMRQCFAYCSLFPEDWKIEKDDLIQLWMAHGYLEYLGEKQSMEDVGNQIVKILFMKSFFQDAQMTEHGDLYSFKMHDLMHDLAMQVAGNDCCYLDSETKKHVGRPMHVWLEPDAIGLLDSLHASRVRTLVLQSYNGDLSDISKYNNLRVFMLWNSSLSNLSNSLGKMDHLRYLKLSRCKIVGSLSQFISNPSCLQTLIWKDNEGFELPTKQFSKLNNLRRVEIDSWDSWEVSKAEMTTRFGEYCLRGWLCSLTNIIQISLVKCRGLEYLPPLERLPFLKSLYIFQLNLLSCIYYEEHILPGSFFPSLESLTLWECSWLRGWVGITRDGINDDTHSSQSLHFSFPRLSQLKIYRCRMLTSMPTFANLDERLELHNAPVEILQSTLNYPRVLANVSHHLVSPPPLSKLKLLHIFRGMRDLNNISKDWLQNLTSLEHLKLESISRQHFREIEIWFKSDLNYLPSLQKITFYDCSYLASLPDWICNLSSLKHIVVEECRHLAFLPEGMSRLTNLMTLEIIGCPLLFNACQPQTSATQPNVAHIPNIILSDKDSTDFANYPRPSGL